MPMYNLIEYIDNYSNTSGSLWQFKRDEQNMNNSNPVDSTSINQDLQENQLLLVITEYLKM